MRVCIFFFSSLHNHPTHASFKWKPDARYFQGFFFFFFGTCCTVYFCASGTCRLVPVRWVGVQLDPAAHWQQKPRWSWEDSPTQQLRFSPLLTCLRDSRWGVLHFLDSLSSFYLLLLFAAVIFFNALILTRRGFQARPAFSSICSRLLSHVRDGAFLQPCTAAAWCHSFLTCGNRMKPDLSLSFCSLNHLKCDQTGRFQLSVKVKSGVLFTPNRTIRRNEMNYASFISHPDSCGCWVVY